MDNKEIKKLQDGLCTAFIDCMYNSNLAYRLEFISNDQTDIDKILPPVSRFGGGNRAAKKKTVIDRLKAYFEKFYGIGGQAKFT